MRRFLLFLKIGIFCGVILAGCVAVPPITDLLQEENSDKETSSQVQTSGQVEVVILEPTPTAIPESRELNLPILFVSNRGDPSSVDIYLVNPDGSGLVRLTDEPGNKSDPSWSPDRRTIAFASDRTGLNQIYLLFLEDMRVEQLTDHPQGAISPSWSPDGIQIVFAEQDPASNSLMMVNSSGEGEISRIPIEVSGVSNPAWAPNEERIAFSALVGGTASERDIYVYDLGPRSLVNLTNHLGIDDNPAWAPDGERIVFQTDRGGDEEIYVMQTDGTLQTPLTNNLGSDVEPDWSGDGSSILYSSDREGSFNLYTMKESGADQEAVFNFPADDRQPRWSVPSQISSGELATAAGISPPPHNLSIFSTSGAQKTQVLQSDETDETMPDWSPDGKQIVFASNLTGNYDIFLIDPDNSQEPTQLTTHAGADMHPSWSPSGGKIAFESKREEGDWDIWVINTDGSQLRNLTADSTANEGNPAWSPDGNEIVFSSDRGEGFDIYLMNQDGTGTIRKLTNLPGDEFHPSWSPDGKQIVFRFTDESTKRSQIYSMNRDGSSVVPLFSSEANDDSPDWSPDGRFIAFTSDRASPGIRNQPGKFDIYMYDIWTGSTTRVSQGDQNVRYPSWRPRLQSAGQ